MNRRIVLLAAGLLLATSTSLFALEITKGNMRLDLTENTGRFSAYYKTPKGDWTPLFYAQDSRTTVLGVLVGNDFYRMGDSSRIRDKVSKTPSGGEISWTSDQFSVTESFAFKSSIGASAADGLLITIKITNNSSAGLKVGARYLIDTYLGEQNRIEFVTPDASSMSHETEWTGSQVAKYWASPNDKKMSVALEAVLRGSGVTTPDRVVFANWKRLNDSGWDYSSDSSRSFNLLPYSINDSAVAMYYDARNLAAGATRTITMLLGQYSAAGWGEVVPAATQASSSPQSTTSAPNAAVTQLLDQASSTPAAPAPSTSSPSSQEASTRALVETDLKTVNGVLDQIQSMLASPQGVSQSDIDGLRQVLDKLSTKKNQAGLQ